MNFLLGGAWEECDKECNFSLMMFVYHASVLN